MQQKAMVEDLVEENAASHEMTGEEKAFCDNRFEEKIKEYDKILTNQSGLYDTEQLEEAMQKGNGYLCRRNQQSLSV